ncbi:MAG: 1-deoxy-D-xylulose-5-phosphate reductoisomerase [Clostridiales bacterium]|nr:1-deoxy-D-xylulose-5-phosphate reductoisomerase [Clostridiales bacterium]
MQGIAILGSTGSIGKQALEVISLHPDRFFVTALTAHRNAALLFEQVRIFRPKMAALTGEEAVVPADLSFCQFYFGPSALEKVAAEAEGTDVLAAVVGVAGLKAVLAARRAGKRVLLANKETLVAGGEMVMDVCREDENGPTLLPVDSEHSAIFQCLQGAGPNRYDKILLTASGGPFRTWERARMLKATVEEALGHPTWNMGAKITVDSASMFNKALEIIEAKWLFDAVPSQIQVVIHPQSIVHSAVQFKDGAVIAQMGNPDMKVPILYAMSYPERLYTGTKELDLFALGSLTFEAPNLKKFPSIRMAYDALYAGGAAACVLNAANEEAAGAFLGQKIPFGSIYHVVEAALQHCGHLPARDFEDIERADALAREAARKAMAGQLK